MNLLFYCKALFYLKVLFYCKVNTLQKKLTIFKTSGTIKQKITEILLKLFCGKIQIINRAVGSFFMVGGEGLSKNVDLLGWPTTKN